jgi:hypothetical protein
MSSADLLAAIDPRALLEQRLEGMQKRRVGVAVLFFGTAALFIGLFVAQGGELSALAIAGWLLTLLFLFYGFVTCWQIATADERNRRFVQLLDLDPGRIKRIYGMRVVSSGRYASTTPIPQPESQNIGESHTLLLSVELSEPSRTKRLLGLHKYVANVSREELLELLSFLRGLAPDAQGPPGKRRG